MKRTFAIVNASVVNIEKENVRERILNELGGAVDKVLALAEIEERSTALSNLGVYYTENTFEFPETALLVKYKSGDADSQYIQCALRTWYSANVSIPAFYEDEFLAGNVTGNLQVRESTRMMHGCTAFIRDIKELIEGRREVLDYGVLEIRVSADEQYAKKICSYCSEREYGCTLYLEYLDLE